MDTMRNSPIADNVPGSTGTAAARISLEDLLWTVREGLTSKGDASRYFQGLGAAYQAGASYSDLAALAPDTIPFENALEALTRACAAERPTDPIAVFDYLFLRDRPAGKLDATAELYRVMDLVASVGCPPALEWMVFLWPSNPHKDEPDGDQTLYAKIVSAVQVRGRPTV